MNEKTDKKTDQMKTELTNITSLKTERDEYVEKVIDMLEGEIEHIRETGSTSAAIFYTNGERIWTNNVHLSRHGLIGALEQAKFDIMAEN